MSKRAYGQFCGLAHALELVGERWALLIVRDLLVGPKRFTDLRRGLPRIPTNVLATRLKELEQAAVVRRRVLPRPAGSVVYELTEHGAGLEPAVMALGRWGIQTLGEPGPGDVLTVDSLIVALRSMFDPEPARGLRVSYQLRMGEIVVHVLVNDGTLEVGAGELATADLGIETSAAMPRLLTGEVDPATAVAEGLVQLTGPADLLTRFVELFHIEPAPTGDSAARELSR
jgi:DNA-binding HxlR family transcriptional regulator